MTKLNNTYLTEKMLTDPKIKELIDIQPINYSEVRKKFIAGFPELVDQVLEDGLRYNFEHKFTGSRATAKSALPPEERERIKAKHNTQKYNAKTDIQAKALAKIADYTELYDEWKASDGTPIYAMTRAKLFKNADQLLLAVATTEKTAVFYQKLAERLGANQTVRDGITAKKYHQIKEEVFQNG